MDRHLRLQMRDAFERHRGEYLKFEAIEAPAHVRPDLCALLMLDRLMAKAGRTDGHLLASAAHDELWLAVSSKQLADAGTTDEEIRDLVRCGVMLDSETDALCLFV